MDLAAVVAGAGGNGPAREIPRREGGGLVDVVRLEGLELVVGLVVGRRRLARLQQARLELSLPRGLLPRDSSGNALPSSGRRRGVSRIDGTDRGLPRDAARRRSGCAICVSCATGEATHRAGAARWLADATEASQRAAILASLHGHVRASVRCHAGEMQISRPVAQVETVQPVVAREA